MHHWGKKCLVREKRLSVAFHSSWVSWFITSANTCNASYGLGVVLSFILTRVILPICLRCLVLFLSHTLRTVMTTVWAAEVAQLWEGRMLFQTQSIWLPSLTPNSSSVLLLLMCGTSSREEEVCPKGLACDLKGKCLCSQKNRPWGLPASVF